MKRTIFNEGATLQPILLAGDEQKATLFGIEGGEWSHEIGRAVQHYGWRYDYRARTSGLERAMPFPFWARKLRELVRPHFGDQEPEQCIVNAYHPGQGIGMHSDADIFGPVIVSVSLGAWWPMRFRQPERRTPYERDGLDGDEVVELPAGSALVLAGPARYRWMHGICRRDSRGQTQPRTSVTFRSLVRR